MLLERRIPVLYVMRGIRYDLLIVFIISAFVYMLSEVMDIPEMPIGIPSFLGTAITLILSFKLAQSYERWWEARKIWGAIVNDSRTLVNQSLQFTNSYDSEVQEVHTIAHRQMAWCFSLGQALRKLDPRGHLHAYINEEEIKWLGTQQNVPLGLLNRHTRDIASLHNKGLINDYQQIQLDSTIQRLCDSMGKSERIKNTVFPKTYRLFLHFFIYIFLATLSISVAEVEGPYQILLLLFVSSPFLLLERTAKLLQDPFENKPTDTSVTAIARTIEQNLTELLNKRYDKPIEDNEDFYVM